MDELIQGLKHCGWPIEIRKLMGLHGFNWRTESTAIGNMAAFIVLYSYGDEIVYRSEPIHAWAMNLTVPARQRALRAIETVVINSYQ